VNEMFVLVLVPVDRSGVGSGAGTVLVPVVLVLGSVVLVGPNVVFDIDFGVDPMLVRCWSRCWSRY